MLLSRRLVARRPQPAPHKLTRREFVKSLFQFLLAEGLVFILWWGQRFLGIAPGRQPVAGLVAAMVTVAGAAIFSLRQNLKGERGIGWPGALVTSAAATSVAFVATVLSSR